MQLLLLHGRKDPNQEMESWGFTAPKIKGVAAVHYTYDSKANVYFKTPEAMEAAKAATGWPEWDRLALEMQWHDDMIKTISGFYGDYELQEDDTPHTLVIAAQNVIDLSQADIFIDPKICPSEYPAVEALQEAIATLRAEVSNVTN